MVFQRQESVMVRGLRQRRVLAKECIINKLVAKCSQLVHLRQRFATLCYGRPSAGSSVSIRRFDRRLISDSVALVAFGWPRGDLVNLTPASCRCIPVFELIKDLVAPNLCAPFLHHRCQYQRPSIQQTCSWRHWRTDWVWSPQ